MQDINCIRLMVNRTAMRLRRRCKSSFDWTGVPLSSRVGARDSTSAGMQYLSTVNLR